LVRSTLCWLALLLAAFIVAGCGDDGEDATDSTPPPTTTAASQSPTAGAYPVTITRSDGVTHTIEARPERVVSLSPGGTEIVFTIGAGEALIAVDNNADYPPEVADVPNRVDAYEPNIEAIAGLDPDLVIVATDSGGVVAALDRLGIPLLYQDLDTTVETIDDVIAMIELYGDVFDQRDEARALAADMRQRVEAVEAAVADVAADRPLRVYHELDSTFYTVAEQTFIGSVYALLALDNIAGDGGGIAYPQLTQEAIIAADPDVIVLADEEFGVTIDSVKARPGWDAIAAVQNDRIYSVDPDIISRPGPRIVDALEQLASQVYPEQFG